MPKRAAGLLLYRRGAGGVEVLLAHPGGPIWAKKDLGAWTIPKGLYDSGETPLDAARREFEEELGSPAPAGPFADLDTLTQPGGKVIHAFAVEADFDAATVRSNLFALEWPPKSGRIADYPEVDRAAWFPIAEARLKILKGQEPFLDRLLALL